MATQFDSLASLQLRKGKKQFTRSASHGERVTKSLPADRRSSSYHRQYKANDVRLVNGSRAGDGKEMTKRKRDRGRARELPRYFGLWYMSSSISYILRKARAFYNEFCCDNYFDDSSIRGHELVLADPYFSFPVIPPPTIAPIVWLQWSRLTWGWREPA